MCRLGLTCNCSTLESNQCNHDSAVILKGFITSSRSIKIWSEHINHIKIFHYRGATKMQPFIYGRRISPSRLAAQGLWPQKCFDCGDPDVQTASAGRRGPSAGLHSRNTNYQTHDFHYVPYIPNTSLHGGFVPFSVLTLLIYIHAYILQAAADVLHIKNIL